MFESKKKEKRRTPNIGGAKVATHTDFPLSINSNEIHSKAEKRTENKSFVAHIIHI